jgi:hypothetical protein
MAQRLKVTLQWIQILDKLEPFYKERGEFRFTARVKADDKTQETRFPTEGHYEISDHPAWNRLSLDRVIYEGEVASSLSVELLGEELDKLSANDKLDLYHRVFRGDPVSFLGSYVPGEDTSGTDPEDMSNWRVAYVIERA